MFGFVFGVLCLIGFVSVLRRRGWRRYGYGYGWHGHGWHGHGWHGHGRAGHGRVGWRGGGWMMYRAFEALDTSPGQEKAIRGALTELRGALTELKPEVYATRAQLAQSLAVESFDAPGVEATVERQLDSLGRVGPVLSRALGQIHEALDPDQRRRLARFLELGPGYGAV
jgi:uncharacterized membrane protein